EINNSFAVVSALLHVPLVLILVPRMGIAGAGLALFINSALQTTVFIAVVAYRLIRVPLHELLTRAILRPAICSAAVVIVGWLARRFVHGALSLVLVVTSLGLGYLMLALMTSALTIQDISRIVPVQRLPKWVPLRDAVVNLLAGA